MTTWIDFAEIRAKVSLEDVLLAMYQLGPRLKRQGDKLIGPCPIHDGDGPRAFHADLAKQAWFCFSRCRKGGNQIDFVAQKEGVTVREAALRLHSFFHLAETEPPGAVPGNPKSQPPQKAADDAGASKAPSPSPTSAPPPTDAPINPKLELRLDLDPTHPHLLKERGLAVETVKRFSVGYCARGILRGMVAIPIRDEDGDLVAYAGRRLKWADVQAHGKYKLPSGFRKDFVLYNLDRAREHASASGLILTEGYFAVLKLFELGFANVVASMGCALSEPQAQLLAEHAADVTILYDGNEAGRGGAIAARTRLEALGVHTRIVWLPDGLQPDTLPPRALRWALRGARELDLAEVRFSLRAPATKPE